MNLYNDYINYYFWFSIIDELELSQYELLALEKIEDNPIKVYKTHMNQRIEKLEGIEKEKYKKARDIGVNTLSQVRED
jgi:hypothetical protein